MRYAQVKGGQKLHLVYEPGEGHEDIVRAGHLSFPLCGRRVRGNYRMTINVSLGKECRNCGRVYLSRHGQ